MKNVILYFIEGATPTNAEFKKAEAFMNTGPFLEFVSLQTLDLNEPIRENVGAAGAVPEAYKEYAIVKKQPKVLETEVAKKVD